MSKPKIIKSSVNLTLQMENFEPEITDAVLSEFYQGSSYDLILKTGPEKYESSCHKLVLASSSDFLSRIISTATPGSIPVLLLPDVETTVVKYLLLYMYKGEVSVPLEDYQDFIEACTLLELKGPVNPESNDILNLPEFKEDTMQSETFQLPELDIDIEPSEIHDEKILYPDQEMEYYDMEENSNDDLNYQYDPLLEESTTSNAKIMKIERGIPTKVSVTRNEAEKLHVRLKTCLRKVYEATGMKLVTRETNKRIAETKLITVEGKLIKAEHICSFCSRQIGIHYQVNKASGKFECWINSSLKKHIEQVHNVKQENLNWTNGKYKSQFCSKI